MLALFSVPMVLIVALREGPVAVLKAIGRGILWFFFPVGGPPQWKRIAYALAVVLLCLVFFSLRSCGAQGVNVWEAAPYDFYRP